MGSAVVIKPFRGVPDGEVYPKQFVAGDVVVGDLASVALEEGWAEPEGGVSRVVVREIKHVDPPAPSATPAPDDDASPGEDAELDDIMSSLGAKKPAPAAVVDRTATVLAELGLDADWRETMPWPKKRSLASSFSEAAVRNGAEADAAIEAEIAKRAGA